MTPQGEFRAPKGLRVSWPMRIGLTALIVSVLCGAIAGAALLIYLALILIPIALAAAAIAYVALRVQIWRLSGRRAIVPHG